MNNHKHARIALLMSMAIGVAVFQNSYSTISVYASEGVQSTNGELSDEVTNGDVTDDNYEKEADDAGEVSSDYAADLDTSLVPSEVDADEEKSYEDISEEEVEYATEDSTDEVSEDVPGLTKEAVAPVDKVGYRDVCFFIRGKIGEGDIPYEPSNHFSGDYSDAIRINNAGMGSKAVVADTTKEDLMDDGFTVANEVTNALAAVPSAEQIAGVVKGFDPSKHYVKWYVYKWATTGGDNYDVFYHVDGVILEKELVPEEEPYKEKTKEEPKEEESGPPEVIIEIKTCCDDMEIEYDGQPHKVGGFSINIIDPMRNKTLLQHIFDWAGVFKETKVYASDGHGTTFEYNGEEYWVNVDAAYVEVTDIGDYDIPFYYKGAIIAPEDIYVLDSLGNVLTSKFDIVPTRSSVRVTKREITLEAGTTVKNDDGKSLTNNTYKITEGSLMPGHAICEVSFIGCQTGPGETSNEISSFVIRDAKGNDVTYMYDVDLTKGRLVLVDNSKAAKNVGTGTDCDDTRTTKANSTGSASTTKVVNEDGTEVVTNSTYELAARGDDGVLGARRADTSDTTEDLYRLFICAIALLAAYMFITRRKRY